MPNWAIVTVVAGVFTCIGQSAAQTAPAVTSVSFTNSPLSGDTYEFGARIDLRVEFDENVRVAYPGSPQLTLGIGATTRQARYWYYSGNSLYFEHIVQAEDVDSNGISVPADALSLNGASITFAEDSAVGVDLSHEAVADDTSRKVDGRIVSAPRIDGVFFPNDQPPRNGETYGPGEEVAVSVSFDKAVAVTGLPQMMIQVGSESRETTNWHHGADLGSRGTKITFYYTVQSDDVDVDGVSVPANAVNLKGGSITLVDHADVAADLSHGAVPDHPNRKVDGSLGAKVISVSMVSSPDRGETYTLGEAVEVALEFDSPVNFCESGVRQPELTLEIGGRRRQAPRSGRQFCQTSSLMFSYDIRPTDRDSDGIGIPGNALTLNGRPSGLADSSHGPVAADPDHKVDGSVVIAPEIAAVSIRNNPRRAGDAGGFPVFGDTFGLGEELVVTVEFDKPVDVTGARPEVALRIGERVRPARLRQNLSARGRIITFYYVFQSVDADSDGVAIPANSLTLNGGRITILGDANTDAILNHDAVASEYKVDGAAVSAPRILYRRIFQNSVPLNGQTFGLGERIWLRLLLDRRPVVTGEPALSLQIGGKNRQASYFPEASQRTILSFEYLVQRDDLDADGFESPADSVRLNGGSIGSAGSADIAANLGHDALSHPLGVDGSIVSAPKVSRTYVLWFPDLGGTYGLGDRIGPIVCFDLPVEVRGEPRLTLNVGGRIRQAFHAYTYRFAFTGSDTCLFFWYTVQGDDLDRDGISIPGNALDLNGGAITLEVDDAVAADLSHEAVEDDGDHRVDGGAAVAPSVTSVSFSGAPANGGLYQTGDVVTVRVGFDRALAVSGEPQLALAVGSRTRYASYAGQASVRLIDIPNIYKRNFFSLSFEYTVQPGDVDADGISVPANALSLKGGSLTLMGSPGTAADLSHSAVNPDETRLVDAPDTAPTFSTAIAGQVFVLTEAVSLMLPEAIGGDGELTYSLSPALPPGLTFDPETRLLGGMPVALADLMAFEYTVTDGDLEDPESATLTFSMSVIAQPATEVGGESAGEDAVEVTWRGPWTDPSRGRLVIEARSPSMDWTVVGTVDPSSGEFIVSGLEPETPYTFRLRFEPTPGVAGRSASAQVSPEYSEEFSVTTGSYTGPCRSGGKYLCLRSGRFELRADWTNPDQAGEFGTGTAVPVDISDESGLFWFFDPANIELVTKVLDGSRLNGHYWMFFGALSDVEYWLTLRDTAAGGSQRTYHNPPKEICGQSDTRAFPGDLAALLGLSSSTEEFSGLAGLEAVRVSAVPLDVTSVAQTDDSAGQCEQTESRLCLLGNRFAIDVSFIDPNIKDPEVDPEGAATVASSLRTPNTGFFWFFNQENIELAVKVLDGRGINGKFWLLYGALSDVEYEITVTDTVTGQSKTYRNEAGSICGEIDTLAF